MTHYDKVLHTLSEANGVQVHDKYLAIGIEEGKKELAKTIITGCGATVTGENSHERGHTIYFEAPED